MYVKYNKANAVVIHTYMKASFDRLKQISWVYPVASFALASRYQELSKRHTESLVLYSKTNRLDKSKEIESKNDLYSDVWNYVC